MFLPFLRFAFIASLIISLLVIPNTVTSQENVKDFPFNNVKLSHDNNFPHHVEPSMALEDDNNIFVGYKNSDTQDGGGKGVSFIKSSDGGDTWTGQQEMPKFMDFESSQSDPWLMFFDDKLYYAYLEFGSTPVSFSQITLASSEDQGITWKLTNATENFGFADKETFTIDQEGNIYIAYDDFLDERVDIRISRSFDRGMTFVDNVTIGDQISRNYLGPYIFADKFTECVIYTTWSWIDETPFTSDIFFDRSFNFGSSWGIDSELSLTSNGSVFLSNPTTNRPTKVTLSVIEQDSTGKLYVIWDDVSSHIPELNWDVWMSYSEDQGTTWSDKIRVNPDVQGDQWMGDFEIDSEDNLHFAYYDHTSPAFYDVKYRLYNPRSNTFEDPLLVSHEPPLNFQDPVIIYLFV